MWITWRARDVAKYFCQVNPSFANRRLETRDGRWEHCGASQAPHHRGTRKAFANGRMHTLTEYGIASFVNIQDPYSFDELQHDDNFLMC